MKYCFFLVPFELFKIGWSYFAKKLKSIILVPFIECVSTLATIKNTVRWGVHWMIWGTKLYKKPDFLILQSTLTTKIILTICVY